MSQAGQPRLERRLLQVPGEAEAALHRLHAKLVDAPTGARRPSGQVQAALEAARMVTGHLRAWGLPGAQVVVDPLLRPHADYYSGTVFQARSQSPTLHKATKHPNAGNRRQRTMTDMAHLDLPALLLFVRIAFGLAESSTHAW